MKKKKPEKRESLESLDNIGLLCKGKGMTITFVVVVVLLL